MTIYVDTEHKCHAYPAADRTAYDLQFFDGKAPGVIECYEYYPADAGKAEQIKAVEATATIDTAQRQYELDESQRWGSLNIPQEQGMTATRNYPAESFLAVQGQIYETTRAIPAYTSINSSNVVKTTIEHYLESIKEE